ncbi:MAG: peptidase M64 [Bacteroidales bacterium]|nr:peptidase M64 [Bacteroidales bacterium]
MKKHLIIAVFALLAWSLAASAQIKYENYFHDATLRLDYVFCGDAGHQAIYLERAYKTSQWAGRRTNLEKPLLAGNGQVKVYDPVTEAVIYSNSFSTLFQEWQSYEEATRVQKAFENCILVPFPKAPVRVEVTLTNVHGKVTSSISHIVDPADILICQLHDNGLDRRVLKSSSATNPIDIVFVAEAYSADEKEKFYADAARGVQALFSHEPYASKADKFSVTAIFSPSQESGVSRPGMGIWHNTATDSHFDTFYTDRYLTSTSMRKIYDIIGTVPVEHIILLVNTPVYGGGGIYNSLTIMGSDHSTFKNVLVHEFGHAFGGLGDEYAYGDLEEPMYPADTEPWEPNLTTLKDFSSKWLDLLPEGCPIPTPLDEIEAQDVRRIWFKLTPEQKASLNLKVGVYEGAGYQMKGVYRPVQECRMRINECEEFCPVCSRAIIKMIDYYSE